MFAREIEVTERGCHEDVGGAPSVNQEADDFLTVIKHPLRGGGFVIDVAGVDLSVVIEKILCDLNGAGEVKRQLAITAAGADESWVRLKKPGELVEEPEARGGMNIDLCAALDGIAGDIGRGGVKKTERPGPPAASGIKIRPGLEEEIEHSAAAHREDRRGIEGVGGIVDVRFQFRTAREQFAQSRNVIVAKRLVRLLK
jgi:hypothetical protein